MDGEEFGFPILRPNEIVECMADAGIPCNNETFTKPKSASIRAIYERCLEMCMGVTREDLHQPSFAAMQLDNPELYTEAITEQRMARYLEEMMHAAQVDDFSMRDILQPTAKRTVFIVSALINLAKFKEEQMAHFEGISGKLEDLADRHHELLEEKQMMEAELRRIKNQREMDEPRVQELEAACDQVTSELQALNIQQRDLGAEIATIKEDIKKVQDKTKTTQFEILQATQQTERMRSQIVDNPDELKQKIADLEASLVAAKESLAEEKSQEKALAARAAALNEAKENLGGLLTSAQETAGELTRVEGAAKELAACQATIQSERDRMESMNNSAKMLKRQATSAQEKLQRAEKQAKSRAAASEKRLQAAIAEKHRLMEQRSSTEAAVEETEARIAQVEAKIADLTARHANDMAEMEATYDALHAQVQDYHNQLYSAMGVTQPLRDVQAN